MPGGAQLQRDSGLLLVPALLQLLCLALQLRQPVALSGDGAVGPVDITLDLRLFQFRLAQLALQGVAAFVGAADLAIDAGDICL